MSETNEVPPAESPHRDVPPEARTAEVTHEPEPVETESDAPHDVLKFGILVLVFLGVIVVIALLRPLIFERIVPAVMGEGITTTQPDENEVFIPSMPSDEPAAGEAEGEGEETGEEEGGETAVDETPPADPTPEITDDDNVGGGVPEEQPAPRQHTVQPGENLITIAETYGVTVDAIIRANNIPNPDRITVGDVIIIP